MRTCESGQSSTSSRPPMLPSGIPRAGRTNTLPIPTTHRTNSHERLHFIVSISPSPSPRSCRSTARRSSWHHSRTGDAPFSDNTHPVSNSFRTSSHPLKLPWPDPWGLRPTRVGVLHRSILCRTNAWPQTRQSVQSKARSFAGTPPSLSSLCRSLERSARFLRDRLPAGVPPDVKQSACQARRRLPGHDPPLIGGKLCGSLARAPVLPILLY